MHAGETLHSKLCYKPTKHFNQPYHTDVYKETHYADVIMGVLASQITSLTIVYSTFHSGADQRKHQSQ